MCFDGVTADSVHTYLDLQTMLRQGLSSLLNADADEPEPLDLTDILGPTTDGAWDNPSTDNQPKPTSTDTSSQEPDTIYQFEGKIFN